MEEEPIWEEEGCRTRMTTSTTVLYLREFQGETRQSSEFSESSLLPSITEFEKRVRAHLLSFPPHAFFPRLYMGHLVLDSPVPSKLLVHCPNKTEKEFTMMR